MRRGDKGDAKPAGLLCEPIGFVRSAKSLKFDTPHQPTDGADERAEIELLPGHNFEHALDSLEGFDRIWLIWWFDRNDTWKPRVLPPRGKAKKRGVFATRSPHRPNPLGITAVRLLSVEGRKLVIGNHDLVDGTPILDIKPYLPGVDSFPGSRIGWLEEVEANSEKREFEVRVDSLAREQLDWVLARGIDLETRSREILERDPSPHRTRRIVKVSDRGFRLGCGAWRIFFEVTIKEEGTGGVVQLKRVTPGYPPAALNGRDDEKIPYQAEQRDFLRLWPDSTW
jgi:tRNA-Thr(GGU) m(6)t(6)A37 methyltransferase TsaA